MKLGNRISTSVNGYLTQNSHLVDLPLFTYSLILSACPLPLPTAEYCKHSIPAYIFSSLHLNLSAQQNGGNMGAGLEGDAMVEI